MTQTLFSHIRFKKDFEVSWAGANPFGLGFCFGSESGAILLTREEGNPDDEPIPISPSQEAVNGVAGLGKYLAVSTREEVTFLNFSQDAATKGPTFVSPNGAHGLITTPSGYFVAPLGQAGIMAFQLPSGQSPPVPAIIADEECLYFYKLISLREPQGQEWLVCACRFGGIGVIVFPWENDAYNLKLTTFDGLDIVDICPIGAVANSLAVAAVGRDGTLILVRDILHDKNPVTLKFDTVAGKAYRLLSCRGHLFLLTSKGMYVLANFAGRFVEGKPIESLTTRVLGMPVEGVDANLVSDRWLLIVMPDGVRKIDIDLIHQIATGSISYREIQELHDQPRSMTPHWKEKTQLIGIPG